MEIATVGIDLGKTVFHVVCLNAAGETVVRKKFSRAQLLRFTANLKVGLIGMEACAGSHFLGRALRQQGHEVRLMPAQYVKPYVKTNKNDYIDAEAIAEAVGRPRMRFVPIKSDEQLDMQSLHRARERWVRNRTALLNQIRGLLLERGITIRQGRRHAEEALPTILEDADSNLTGMMRQLLGRLTSELKQLEVQIAEIDEMIAGKADDQEACQRLMSIPGIGPITATAIVSAVGNGTEFRKGRGFSAWLGLTPAEYSTEGKQKLLGISKRGNGYLRKLLVHGGTCLIAVPGQAIPWSKSLAGAASITGASQRRHHRLGQQDGSHGMGVIGQRRDISATVDGKQYGGGCAAAERMSFLRHWRSFVR